MLHQFCVFIFAAGAHCFAVYWCFKTIRSCICSWAQCSARVLSLQDIPAWPSKQANHSHTVSIHSEHKQNKFMSACKTLHSSCRGLIHGGVNHSQLPLIENCNAAQITLLCLSFLIQVTMITHASRSRDVQCHSNTVIVYGDGENANFVCIKVWECLRDINWKRWVLTSILDIEHAVIAFRWTELPPLEIKGNSFYFGEVWWCP